MEENETLSSEDHRKGTDPPHVENYRNTVESTVSPMQWLRNVSVEAEAVLLQCECNGGSVPRPVSSPENIRCALNEWHRSAPPRRILD